MIFGEQRPASLSESCIFNVKAQQAPTVHTHTHTPRTLQTTDHYTVFHCLLNVYENTRSAAEKRNIPALLSRARLQIIESIIQYNNKHCGECSTHKGLLAGQAFRWVKKLSEEQKHHYPSACISTKYFSNESGRAAEILFNQGPLQYAYILIS